MATRDFENPDSTAEQPTAGTETPAVVLSPAVSNPAPSSQSQSKTELLTPEEPESKKVQFDGSAKAEEPNRPALSQMISPSRRAQTSLHHSEERFVPHKYAVRRPRPLQVKYHGKIIDVGDAGKVDLARLESLESEEARSVESHTDRSSNTGDSSEGQERSTDDVKKQRERLDLFVDLVWVGIISNLAENFYNETFSAHAQTGLSTDIFIVLFVPAWTIWYKLQLFLNHYFMDDALQRYLIVWILACSVVFGNAAPTAIPTSNNNHEDHTGNLIAIFLVAVGSLQLAEFIYSFWIPWARRNLYFNLLSILPASGMWIAATLTEGQTRLSLMWGAIGYERLWQTVTTSPLFDRWASDRPQRAFDMTHIRKRYENFFIIALGEGVVLLIRQSPLGNGITPQGGRGILALVIYFCLHTAYFNGDGAKMSVHPVYRRWYIRGFWQFLHLPLFGSLVVLSSSVLYIIGYEPEAEKESKVGAGATGGEARLFARGETASEGELVSVSQLTLQIAIITCCVCLAIIMLCLWLIAMLAKPLDGPKTLLVNNRYIRLAPRLASVVIFATIYLTDFTDPTSALGAMTIVVWGTVSWEWYASLESGARFFEPKDTEA